MAFIQGGNNPLNTLNIQDNKAARAAIVPNDVINWQSFTMKTGLLTGAAAGSSIGSLRNGGSNLLLIRRIGLGIVENTAFTTAQLVDFACYVARGYTVADSGGTQINLGGNNNKHRTSLTTLSGTVDLRIAAAAALTAGTRTLDSTPVAGIGVWAGAVGTLLPKVSDNLFAQHTGDYPLVLAQNEGLILSPITLMGAAGVLTLYWDLEFAEVDPTKYI